MKIPLFEEMENVGIGKYQIYLFTLIGVALWAIILWLFVERYLDLQDTTSKNENLNNITIIIISFHVLTFVFTLGETFLMAKNIWFSWMIIAFALTATFLNTANLSVVLGADIEDSIDEPYKNASVPKAIASLILQVVANSLMTAYIFRLIRSKNKLTY